MSTTNTLKDRYAAVKQRIAEAASRSGRRGKDIILIAVTKNAAMDEVRQLIELGHVDFGENRVQQMLQRAAQVDEYLSRLRDMTSARDVDVPEAIRWHMIGHLQRNKVRKLIGVTRLIHSVDSLRLVEEIQAASEKRDEPVEVLVQVNVTGEKQKEGTAPAAVRHLIDQINTTMHVVPRGLMCMAQGTEDPQETRQPFELCAELFSDVKKSGLVDDRFNLLSMGMTNDFEVAIECGANIVRVGRAIFGESEQE